jgi:hypothetical protein
MPPQFIRIQIMNPESESDSDDESMFAVMDEFKKSMESIVSETRLIDTQVKQLFQRAKKETTDWLNEPLRAKPAVKVWLEDRGLSSPISIEQFIDACYSAAKTMDLETRMLTFSKEDAAILWEGRRRISVFELTAMIPALFV